MWVALSFIFFTQIAIAQTSNQPPPWVQDFEASQKDPLGHALTTSRIRGSDPIQIRINKLLFLLNHNNYLQNFKPESNPFRSLNSDVQGRIEKMIAIGRYEMDSLRTPEEMLRYRCGGFCGTYALSFARLLEKSGISSNRIRIVSAAVNDDFQRICPGKRNQVRNLNYQGGASGHVFVMVQMNPEDEKSWTLINTTQDPFRPAQNGEFRGTHGKDIAALATDKTKSSHNYPDAENLIQSLDSSDVEMTDWRQFPFTPKSLVSKISNHPVAIPKSAVQSIPRELNLNALTVFSVNTLEDYPRHTFQERLNFIASGRTDDMKCRYRCSEMQKNADLCKPKNPVAGCNDEK